MEAVGTWPRPTIAISGRCFRMMEMPVWREFVFQRTSNEPIVRPRMSMCRIASWSVSMIRQLMRFIPPLFYESDRLGHGSARAGPGASQPGSFYRNQPCRDRPLIVIDVLDPETRKGYRLNLAPSLRGRNSGIVDRDFDNPVG